MAKTRRSSKGAKKGGDAPKRRGRGGRKPGVWKHITPDEIVAYREAHGLGRQRLANMLGVSATSVQNWESGTVATPKIQLKLRKLFDSGPPPEELLQRTAPRSRAWTIVTPEEIEAYREREGLSYYALAVERLGVSPGSVGNWLKKRSAVASPRMQERIKTVMEDPSAWRSQKKGDEAARAEEARASAAGAIVSRFLETQRKDVSPDQLLELIRSVRDALD